MPRHLLVRVRRQGTAERGKFPQTVDTWGGGGGGERRVLWPPYPFWAGCGPADSLGCLFFFEEDWAARAKVPPF